MVTASPNIVADSEKSMTYENQNSMQSQLHSPEPKIGNAKTQKTYKLLKALHDIQEKNGGLQYEKSGLHRNLIKERIRLALGINDPHAVNSWVSCLFDIKVLSLSDSRNFYALNNRTLESHLTLLQNLNGEKTLCSA